MKIFRSLNCLVGVCLVLFLILSTLVLACSSQSTSTSTPISTSTVQTSTSASTVATSTTAKTTTSATSTATTVVRSILGCPQGDPSPQTPQYGGTLKIINDKPLANIGAPWKSMGGAERPWTRFTLENLVGLDTKGNTIPQLATSWDSNPTSKTITFTLRQGVKFHDGTDFNAAAVKWNLDMVRNGTLPDLKAVTSVDVLDDYHVLLTLSSWDPVLLNTMSSGGTGKMVSPAAAQKLGDDILRNPVGTGPFKFVSFTPNVSVKFARWDNYWQKGLPYLDAVEVNMVSDPVVGLASFTKGEAQCLMYPTTTNAKLLKSQGNTVVQNLANIWGFAPDSKNSSSVLSDIRIRRAIAYAIESGPIVNSVFDGMKDTINQLAVPGRTAYDPNIHGYPYNPAKAQELLAQAGYSAANPLTTKIIYTSNQQQADLYTAIQSGLKKIGINLNLEALDNATTTKYIATGWNNGFTEYRFSYNGIETKYSTSLVMALSPNCSTWVSVWLPDDFNTLYKVMTGETDLAKREEYYKALNKMAVDDYCVVIPLYVNTLMAVTSPKVHDLNIFNVAAFEFLPETAWISK